MPLPPTVAASFASVTKKSRLEIIISLKDFSS
jgi:hypothetical protein